MPTSRSSVVLPSAQSCSLPSGTLTASRRVSHPVTLVSRGIASSGIQNTPSRFPSHPKVTPVHELSLPSGIPAEREVPHSTSSLPRKSRCRALRIPAVHATADAVSWCVSEPPVTRLPQSLHLLEAMTVGRPVLAPEVSAHRRTGGLLFEQRLPPHGRLASPGLRSAAILRLALPCGTVESGTCLEPPLDGVGASPDRDVRELFVPLDTRHLSMSSLCRRRPENLHCCWLSDPRVS